MLKIKCPWCGQREETEFTYGGEANVMRPQDPYALDDQKWAEYLYFKKNTMGDFEEQWNHAHGCRKWFNIKRNTLTNEILS
jgi:sarcosine oxidase, subunit delta